MPALLVPRSEISPLCQWFQAYCVPFSIRFQHLTLGWGLWCIWSWVLCRKIYIWVYFHSTTCSHSVCWRCCLSSVNIFALFVKIQVSIGIWHYIWLSNYILLTNMSVFMPISSCFIDEDLCYKLKSEMMTPLVDLSFHYSGWFQLSCFSFFFFSILFLYVCVLT